MGVSPDNLDIIIDLHRKGYFAMPARIADLGCEQIYEDGQEVSHRFLKHFGKQVATDHEALLRNKSFVGHLYTAAGFEYHSFDVVDAPFCQKFDLNVDQVPERWWRQFDLVFNFGTTEHVMNQYNSMRVMHDFVKLGGLIYTLFLINGYQWHGIIRYTVRFIDMMIKANEYEILRDDVYDQTYSQWRKSVGPDEPEERYFRDMCRWLVLRKTTDRSFREIVDVE